MNLPNANNFLFYDVQAGLNAHLLRRLKPTVIGGKNNKRNRRWLARDAMLAVQEFMYRYEAAREQFIDRMKRVAGGAFACALDEGEIYGQADASSRRGDNDNGASGRVRA